MKPMSWLCVLLLWAAPVRAQDDLTGIATDLAAGRFPVALTHIEQALEQAQDQPHRLAQLLDLQGVALTLVRRVDLAEQSLQQALTLARQQQDPALLARVLNNLGNLELLKRQPQQAMLQYEGSAAAARQGGDAPAEARALANLAALAVRTRHEQAEFHLARAVESAMAMPPSPDAAAILINVGQTQARHGQARAAYDSYQKALQHARAAADPRLQSSAAGALAQLYYQQHRHDEAIALARQAAFLAQVAAAPDLRYRWQWLIGQCQRDQGDLPAAVVNLQAAVQTLESIKSDVAVGFGNHHPDETFRGTTGPLYYELADLLLRQAAASPDHAQQQALLLAARDVVELLKSAELADYFQDQCVARVQQKARRLDEVAQDTAVVYIIPLPDRTELLVGLNDGLQQVRCEVGEQALTEQVRLLREGLEDRTTFDFMPPARQLHAWLIAPIQSLLQERQISTLVFVPDGSLRTIPMAALHDGERFLAERYATAVAPGLTLIDPQPIARRRLDLLMAGLSEPVQGFPPLQYVPQELQGLQQMYGGTKLIDQQFKVPDFEQRVEQQAFAVVHIASHGEFGSSARSTFLLTYDDRLTLDGLERLIRPTQFRGQPVELLSLSACQTAAGDDRAALGLAGIAIKSGARSALATLWFVNDQASSELVASFYRNLQQDPTLSKAQALRRAQETLLGDVRYRHPCYWAPYLIIGNWL